MMNGWSGSPSAWEWVWMLVGLIALWALAGAGDEYWQRLRALRAAKE